MPYPAVAVADIPYGPQVSFRTQSILPPSAVYVAPGDAAELQARSPSVSTPVTLTLRILTPHGEVKELVYSVTIATSGTAVQTTDFSPQEGFVLSAHLQAINASRGQCFVKLFLRKNPGASDVTLGALLFQGYVSSDDHLSYPQSPTQSSLDGRGWTHTVKVANPPAATAGYFVVPVGVRWLFKSILWQFVTDATVGNRQPVLNFSDASLNLIAQIVAPWQVPASQSVIFAAAPGFQFGSTIAQHLWPMPADIVMGAGYQAQVNASFIGAGDSVSLMTAQVEEWVAQ